MTISEFIARCDRYRAAADVSETWLSKRLLKDTYWLGKLARGEADIGVGRLERAVVDLDALEAELAERRSDPAPPSAGAPA